MMTYEEALKKLEDTFMTDKEYQELLRTALQKQVVMKPVSVIEDFSLYRCPTCNASIPLEDYCEYCGQKLDWEGVT